MPVANQVQTGNFSYRLIPSGKEVTIPEGQQMIVYDSIQIDGELIINEGGEIVCLTFN